MFKISVLFFILIVFSCKGKKEEIINFNDITEESKNNYDSNSEDSTKEIGLIYKNLSTFSKSIIDSLNIPKSTVHWMDTMLFSDRFGAVSNEKWYAKTENDSLVFQHWRFKDSIKTYNTFYNWLDCYGPSCKSIRIGEKVTLSKHSLLFLVGEKDLIRLETTATINYEKLLEDLEKLKLNSEWKYIVYQAKRKKAAWFYKKKESPFVEI